MAALTLVEGSELYLGVSGFVSARLEAKGVAGFRRNWVWRVNLCVAQLNLGIVLTARAHMLAVWRWQMLQKVWAG